MKQIMGASPDTNHCIDMFGRTINPGDFIAWHVVAGRRSDMRIGKVLKVSNELELSDWDRKHNPGAKKIRKERATAIAIDGYTLGRLGSDGNRYHPYTAEIRLENRKSTILDFEKVIVLDRDTLPSDIVEILTKA